MPQYDLAYNLTAFNWRNTTGSDNDYRLVKNGNALSWKRKDDLVVGDLVVDSYDTDTSAIYHRAIVTTSITQATWNVGDKATAGNAEWDDVDSTAVTPIATWNSASTSTGFSDPGSTNAFYSAGGANAFLFSETAKTGTAPTTTLVGQGQRTIRRADNSATITGNVELQSDGGTWQVLRITSTAAMGTAFGNSDITSGPDWVLERQVTVPTLNAFTYTSPLTGSIPTDTSGMWELELSGNSNPARNTKVSGTLTLNTTNNTILVGTLAAMRTAWGNGTDLNSGGGTWTLRKIT